MMIPISSAEPHKPYVREAVYMCNTPPLATLHGARNKQANKVDAQLVIPIGASLKLCVKSEQGKSTTVA